MSDDRMTEIFEKTFGTPLTVPQSMVQEVSLSLIYFLKLDISPFVEPSLSLLPNVKNLLGYPYPADDHWVRLFKVIIRR